MAYNSCHILHNHLKGQSGACLGFALLLFIFSSCCRPATAYQVQKWERKYKFESPRKFWGLHINLHKKNVYKYR